MNTDDQVLETCAAENIAQTVARLTGGIVTLSAAGFPFVLHHAGQRVTALEHALAQPERIRQRVDLLDAVSFIAYLNRFREPSTLIYSVEATLACMAVIDHSAPGDPRWGSHVATLTLQPTQEWQTWLGMHGKKMGQLDFAQFLEDNLPDIAEPRGADVLDMARQLDVKKGVAFASSVRLDNGQTQLTYTEDIQGSAAKGTLALLDTFVLGLAPFEGAPLYKLTARLRYRLQESRLVLWFDLVRPRDVVHQAWRDVITEIVDKTSIPAFAGKTSGQHNHPLAVAK